MAANAHLVIIVTEERLTLFHVRTPRFAYLHMVLVQMIAALVLQVTFASMVILYLSHVSLDTIVHSVRVV